jgi:hypothetical protein
LQGAQLNGSDLRGAVLSKARLQNASLNSTNLQGADLETAQLQGASMTYVNLQGAVLQNADLRGADLRFANLQGAVMIGADLQGANLKWANLHGADLTNARLACSDLTGAGVWFATQPRETEEPELETEQTERPLETSQYDCRVMADVDTIVLKKPDADFRKRLAEAVAALKNIEAVHLRVIKRLSPFDLAEEGAEHGSWELKDWWTRFIRKKQSKDYETKLTVSLAKFACKNYNIDMDVVRGLMRRSKPENFFNGHPKEFDRILKDLIRNNECPEPPPAGPSLGTLRVP